MSDSLADGVTHARAKEVLPRSRSNVEHVPPLASLADLFDAHAKQALGVAYGIVGNISEAEDVVQEVFLSAWKSRATFDPGRGTARTWILSMVRNRSIDVIRARKRQPVMPLDPDVDFPNDDDVSGEAISRTEGAVVRNSLAHLPPQQREVIELAYFRGMSHTEISNSLGLPMGTVKGRIRLAMDRLRTLLGPPSSSSAESR